jgi:hypothetical protein
MVSEVSVTHVIVSDIIYVQVVVAHHAPAPGLDSSSKHPWCHRPDPAQGPPPKRRRLKTRCARKGGSYRIVYQNGFRPRHCSEPTGSVHRISEDVAQTGDDPATGHPNAHIRHDVILGHGLNEV